MCDRVFANKGRPHAMRFGVGRPPPNYLRLLCVMKPLPGSRRSLSSATEKLRELDPCRDVNGTNNELGWFSLKFLVGRFTGINNNNNNNQLYKINSHKIQRKEIYVT